MIAIVQPIVQATIEFIGIIVFTTQPLTPMTFATPASPPTLTPRTVTPATQPNQYSNPAARVGNDAAAGPAVTPRAGSVAAGPAVPPRVGSGPATRPAVPQTNDVTLAQDVVAILPPVPRGIVEPHTQLILFPTAAFMDMNGWTKVDLEGGRSYIVLSKGDQVTFQTGAANPRIRGPKNLPHLKSEVTAQQSVQGLDLVAGYKAPGYSSAAAVVKLSEGVLQECSSASHGGRADTHVRLNTNGILVIASGPTKRLRLRADQSPFTVANVPLRLVITPPTTPPHDEHTNHYLAYCAMLNVTVANCTTPQLDLALPACLGTEMLKTNAAMASMGGSADCSNTQWP